MTNSRRRTAVIWSQISCAARSQNNRIKQCRAWLLLGWVAAKRSCPCKQPACPAIGSSKVTFKPFVICCSTVEFPGVHSVVTPVTPKLAMSCQAITGAVAISRADNGAGGGGDLHGAGRCLTNQHSLSHLVVWEFRGCPSREHGDNTELALCPCHGITVIEGIDGAISIRFLIGVLEK
ncbi:hypothetical protein J6590_052137 [Homalodisca vitripennis]|nr:hypothetical protein J6590_052137 [Homalodisca vitripennis]